MIELLSNNTIPLTGINFLIGSVIYFYLARRFYKCHKSEQNQVAKFFSWSFLLLGLNYLIVACPCLFLIDSAKVWRFIDPFRILFMFSGFFLMIYTVVYLTSKRYLPLITVILAIVAVSFSLLAFLNPPSYFFVDGILDWELGSRLTGQLTGALYSVFILMVMLPVMVFFFRQARRVESKQVKIRSIGLGLFMLWSILGGLTDMFLITTMGLHPIFSELNYFIVFIILLFTMVKTWVPARYEKL